MYFNFTFGRGKPIVISEFTQLAAKEEWGSDAQGITTRPNIT